MSSFTYHQHPSSFLLDSVFYHSSDSITKASSNGFMEDQSSGETPNFSLFYPSNIEQPLNQEASPSSSILQMEDKLESEERVTQMLTDSIDQKKNGDASSLTTNSLPFKKPKKINSPLKDKQKHNEALEEEEEEAAAAAKGYIHVRARRGQATDSHSLAERMRREKIGQRMKLLQSLVPGCDRVTGKALMLDEIINYVQSLQDQVEFLSMKLASVSPMFHDCGMSLDTSMIRTEQCSSIQPTAFVDTANNYPLLDTSSVLLLQQGQRPIQDNGELLWGEDDQRQKLFNQSGFSSNLCSYHWHNMNNLSN